MATPLPLSPFVDPEKRFVLDQEKFLLDTVFGPEASPAFLSAPRPEYLRATEIFPVLEVLAGY